MKKIVLSVITISFLAGMGGSLHAQDNLVNSLSKNVSDNSKASFQFTEIINLSQTPVQNQASSGTCWSYSGNSFIESEMIRMGKKPIVLSQVFTARHAYQDRAVQYVKMHGNLALGEGGVFHDVLNVYEKYGAVPYEAYTGLNYGTNKNQFGEMSAALEGFLSGIVQNKNGKLTPNWTSAYAGILDAYLGKYPATFTYEGKKYTPKTFANERIGIKASDYVAISSFKEHPYYKQFILMIPDNWALGQYWNVPMNELTMIIDNALKNGYTVAWAQDVSEKSFSWKNGVAYIPEKDYADMTEQERKDMFNGPKPERKITEEMRQQAFDNYETTDDHGMHIVGLAKDQNGKEYYIIKNSWGESNDYKGYMYVTKAYVDYKTLNILVHKDAVPKNILNKLK
ncbi:aminopeptidase C [Vaginella massiliensis]|uniref:aminopeptidase C n=1 Tax=Vaginella massiliensis TaxID=1816680 RepID=UPI0037514AC4